MGVIVLHKGAHTTFTDCTTHKCFFQVIAKDPPLVNPPEIVFITFLRGSRLGWWFYISCLLILSMGTTVNDCRILDVACLLLFQHLYNFSSLG